MTLQTSIHPLATYPESEIHEGVSPSSVSKPIITFKPDCAYVSTATLKLFPDVDTVKFCIFPTERKLAIKPCGRFEYNAIRWRSANKTQFQPRYISCKEFSRKVYELMQWNSACRYRMFGKTIFGGDEEILLAFDLNLFEIIPSPNNE